MKSNSLRWGILGTSFISDVMAKAIQTEGRSHVQAVAGRNQNNLTDFATRHQIEHTFTDYDALIQDQNVDIIYIALPNHLHHDYTVRAARAGKAVLCEKSLSIDMEKTRTIETAVNEHNIFFAEGLMYRNHLLIARLLELLDQNIIGDIKHIEGSYSAAIAEFVNVRSMGAIFNLGCYPASLAHLVLQHACPELTLTDYTLQATGRRGADNNICDTSAQFNFNDQVQLQLHCAEDFGLYHSFKILGTKGYIEMTTNPWLPDTTNSIRYGVYEQEQQQIDIPAEGDAFLYQTRNVIDAIASGKKHMPFPAADLNESVSIMQWLTDWHEASQNC